MTMKPKTPSKKYKLIKVADGEAAPPCAFFNSPQGCRNGDSCKFSHVRIGDVTPASSTPKVIKDVDSSSCVSSESSCISSESEGEIVEERVPSSSKQKKRQRSSTDDDGDKNNSKETPVKKFKLQSDLPVTSPSINKKDNSAKLVQKELAKKKKAEKNVKKEESTPPSNSFRDLALPVKPFSATPNKTESSTEDDAKSQSEELVESPPPKDIIPKSTREGKKWTQAILATRKHSRYEGSYDIEKYKAGDEEHGRISTPQNGIPNKWVKPRPYGEWCANNPQAICIDCEMCETENPKTGATDPKALCRLSVINASNPDEVLIDTLVKPHWPVSDDRCRINGIKASDLDNVQFTLEHAQAFMLALCSQETVIIGHAVHNDLVALKMEHYCNVDSSFLFPTLNAEDNEISDAPCSLKDLADQVLKVEMPKVHDSVNDCQMTVKCLEEGYIKKGCKPVTIKRTLKKSSLMKRALIVHRIPKSCTTNDIDQMFVTLSHVKPKEVSEITFKGKQGRTDITFPSAKHANLAFESIESRHCALDKGGFMAKRIYLDGGGYIEVRKNVKEPKEAKDTETAGEQK